MKNNKAGFLAVTLIALSYFGIPAVTAVTAVTAAADTGIMITPPAPVVTDAERQAELGSRRSAVRGKMGKDSVLIMFSTEPRIYTNDVDYYYRQENDLYYLTTLKQEHATLVLLPGNEPFGEVLFIPKKNPAAETWTGKMYSKDDARRLSGISTILYDEELKPFLDSLKAKKAFVSKEGESAFNTNTLFGSARPMINIYLLLPYDSKDEKGRPVRDENGHREFPQEVEFSDKWKAVGGFRIENAQPFFDEMRQIKSPYELRMLQHAIDISTEAHMRSWAMAPRAKMEYEIQAEVEYTFRRRNADYWGYPSIVGCGPNATTLHYETNQGPVHAGDLQLMDVGAEYEHYSADVTRTFPVNGKFSPAQAEIYQAVYDAQEAVAKVVKPGAKMDEVEQASAKSIQESLARLGLITGVDDIIPGTEKVERTRRGKIVTGIKQYTIWFMHGNSHWLGMNVHDVGAYDVSLAPGMTFTNEPGIYIREDALSYFKDSPEMSAFLDKIRPAFEKYKNIGVRIEDDMLVTDTGVEWMTKRLPRTIKEIESFMKRNDKGKLDYGE
jgi:Xaa-Pro aminopeptidase